MRQAIVRVTPELLVELLKAGERHFVVTDDPLPNDAQFVRAFVDHQEGSVCLVVESEAFEDVPRPYRLPFVKTPSGEWRDP